MLKTVQALELFSSIQGEGLYVGCRQLFLRLAGCNLQCPYCDTPDSRTIKDCLQIEETAGSDKTLYWHNPVSIEPLVAQINRMLEQPHHSVSITGGEPLCQAEAIAVMAPQINAKIYLETNGTMPKPLRDVLPFIDIISMDIKLPSLTKQEYWQQHAAFLEQAAEKEVFVKVVVAEQTTEAELKQASQLICAVDSTIPLILQPVTPMGGCEAVDAQRILEWQSLLLKNLHDVRVIPQTHKFMGQR